MTTEFLASKETVDQQKANTSVVQTLVVLLWVVIMFAIAVLPAAVIAAWRWFL